MPNDYGTLTAVHAETLLNMRDTEAALIEAKASRCPCLLK